MRNLKRERGATMVEMALAVPVFIIFIVLFIDGARFAAVEIAVEAGAKEALALAQTIPALDADTRGDVNSQEVQLFKLANLRVLSQGLRLPVQVFRWLDLPGTNNRFAELLPLRVEYPEITGNATTVFIEAPIAVLRPADRALDTTNGVYIDHSVTPYVRPLALSPEVQMKYSPVQIIFRYRFRFLNPLLTNTMVVSKTFRIGGAREQDIPITGMVPSGGEVVNVITTVTSTTTTSTRTTTTQPPMDCWPNWAGHFNPGGFDSGTGVATCPHPSSAPNPVCIGFDQRCSSDIPGGDIQ